MNARDLIAQFLEQWLQLTQLESQAIQKACWTQLRSVQAAKAALQRSMRPTLDNWKRANGPGSAGSPAPLSAVALAEAEALAKAGAAPSQEMNNASRLEGRPAESQSFFGAAVDHLLALETRNAQLLLARRQKALERIGLLEQAARNLRLVRDSYAREPALAWQMYS